MRINPVSNIYSYNNNLKQNFTGKFKSPLDTKNMENWLSNIFWRDSNVPKAEDIKKGALLLNLTHTMSGIEFINLTAKQKQVLRKLVPNHVKIAAEDNYNIACRFRNYLNNNYGDMKNCTLLIIGRSLASVGETLSHMGGDVKFLPMSGIMDYNYFKNSMKGKDIYRQYLTSIGLTKEKIKSNPNHQYLIMDYVCTGTSLKNAYKMLTSDEFLGNSPNIKMLSSQDVLGWNYKGLLHSQELKIYSPIEALQLWKFKDVFKAADPYKCNYNQYKNLNKIDITKLFRFYLFEILNKNKELKSLC